MNHSFDSARIATCYGIAPADLGIALVPYRHDGVDYENVLLFDRRREAGTAGVMAVPNFLGVRQQALEIAATTVGAGFPVMVTDVYGQSVRPGSPDEAMQVIAPLRQDRSELRRRMNAALASLQVQDVVPVQSIGACGFCFGGAAALELARSGADLRAFASLHGSLDSPTPADAKNIRGAVLVLHGAQDPSVPREQVNQFIDEMSAAQVDWQLLSFGQAGHSYTDPNAARPGFFYHAKTAHRAARALREFFAEQLQQPQQ